VQGCLLELTYSDWMSMASKLVLFLRLILSNGRDMLPVVIVVVAFQYLVIQQPFPDVARLVWGALLVLLGLTLFIRGLTMSLFPLGESLVSALAYRANIWLLLAFAFSIGFGSTVAEPALIAVTEEAARAAYTEAGPGMVAGAALLFRLGCALAVGLAVTVGSFCIVRGWPTVRLVLVSYALVAVIAVLTQQPLAGIAFDAGAAATSAINIPLISAMSMGLATMIRGRSPMVDGFGVVACCSVMPMLVLIIGTSLFS